MKWFKHETNSSHNERLALLESSCGLEGYGFYWKVMEIIAGKVEEVGDDSTFSVAFPIKTWCKFVGTPPKNFQKLLENCQAFGLFSASCREVGGKKVVEIASSDIADKADEYTARKTSRQRKEQGVSGQYRDNVGADKNRLDKSRLEESREEDIKDLRISNEIREDFSSSSGHDHDSERDILSEATEYDSTGSVGFTGLETISSSKRKTAVDGNDRNRKSSDNAERDANAKDKNLEDCEKDHESVCALDAGTSSDGGVSDFDDCRGSNFCTDIQSRICEYREASREPDLAAETGFCDSACGLGDSGGSSFCASAHAHACDGRRTSRAQEDASVPASEDVSGAASGNAPGNAPADVPVLDDDVGHEQTAPASCPHKEIVALYHEVLPELRRVCAWNATREKHLRARWREDKRRQSLSWWREYFTRVKASSFLTGKKTDWSADFDWLIRPTNMAKVLEGKYDDSPPHERAQTHERARGTNVETLFRELVSSWPADRVGDVQAAKKTFCSVIDVGIEEGNRRLKNLESWALVVLEREPKYVPRLDKWLAGLDVSIPPPESRPAQYEWVPVEDGELEAVAS